MDTMVVLVPSRTRPANIARLMQAWADTGATAELVVLVDDDDPTLEEYRALDWREGFVLNVGKRQRIGPLLNEWAPLFVTRYDVVGFMGDDHCPRTIGWDKRILEASTPWTVVYGDDLFQGENLPTAVFMGSGLIGSLGWFNPPGLDHLYLDDSWKLIGDRLGTLTYLPDVVIEHVHYLNGKAPVDALYQEVNDPNMYSHDQHVYVTWANGPAMDDINRVAAEMEASR
jgi:hypothetical protein